MADQYTERARRTFSFARYEASRFGSPTIESEHLLLGLLRAGKNPLSVIFGLSNVEAIRAEIEAALTPRDKTSTSADLPLSSESKRILACGAEETMRLNQGRIGIEHLILGILREDKCIAAKILIERALSLDKARKLIAKANEPLAAPVLALAPEIHRATRTSPANSMAPALVLAQNIPKPALAPAQDIQPPAAEVPVRFGQLDLPQFDGLIWLHLKAFVRSFRVGLGGRSS